MAGTLAASRYIGGFNFEGGSRIISNERYVIDNFAEGIAWILKNTSKDITLLMPGYWPSDQIGSEDEVDELIERVRTTVLQLDSKLSAKMKLPKGQNAICTNRITLIPASYGQPVHVKALPPERNGHLAGTVTGQIKLLYQMRQELCGGG